MLVAAAVAPHGGLAVEEWCAPEERDLAHATREAFAELGRRLAVAAPEALVVVTPHNVHVEGHFAVIEAGAHAGALDESEAPVELRVPGDTALAAAILAEAQARGLPALGVTFGVSSPEASEMPMDWGTLIPLWHLGGRGPEPPAVAVVTSARTRPPEENVELGRAIAAAAAASPKRVALVASADHGHAHDPDGPYGFDPASAEYDERVMGILRRDRLGELLDLDVGFVERAKADSFWQLLVLHGALGDGWEGELLSYEAPTYFGMACAAYAPRAGSTSPTS